MMASTTCTGEGVNNRLGDTVGQSAKQASRQSSTLREFQVRSRQKSSNGTSRRRRRRRVVNGGSATTTKSTSSPRGGPSGSSCSGSGSARRQRRSTGTLGNPSATRSNNRPSATRLRQSPTVRASPHLLAFHVPNGPRRRIGTSSRASSASSNRRVRTKRYRCRRYTMLLEEGQEEDEEQSVQEQLLLVADEDHGKVEDDDDDHSISSEQVQARNAYWESLLNTALTQLPTSETEDSKEDSTNEDSSSRSSSTSCGEEEDVTETSEGFSQLQDLEGDWTDLTKDPQVLLGIEFHGPLEDYSVPRTSSLADLLWARDYTTAEERILTHPEETAVFVDLPAQVTTTSKARGLPLHLAAAMRPLPPLSIFQLLLSVHPDASHQPEAKWGLLPLHLAVNLRPSNDNDKLLVTTKTNTTKSDMMIPILETLLAANPAAVVMKELYQGRTPLHVAVSTTQQSMDGRIPPVSHQVLTCLLEYIPSTEALWETDSWGDAAYDIALRESSTARSFVLLDNKDQNNWKPNPLWQLAPTHTTNGGNGGSSYYGCPDQKHLETMKKLLQQTPPPEDHSFHTDATSVTVSLSCASFVTEANDDSKVEESLLGEAEEEEDEEDILGSIVDDATFITAYTHERMSTVAEEVDTILDPTLEERDDDDDDATILTLIKPEDAIQSDDADFAMQPAVKTPDNVPYIPRAVQVEKVQLQLQVQVFRLARTCLQGKALRIKAAATVNPYFQVEFYHEPTDVSIVLHKSDAFCQQKDALWMPVRFAIDASLAQSMGMLLSIDVYHKHSVDDSKKKKTADEMIGGHQASPWELAQSHKKIPLKKEGHPKTVTGQLRLVSYEMTELNKKDCWRVFL
ncbi:expressed unknown protein [Seminavis robusta]|uniref:Uncharacterized protein n=1 Tax=Seminavis robusta TaxID=568900 RepID=A0A9N8HHK1_9STRA|nr:expressed unknown protein [Seminavis robusta]|eukprot:Sro540_g162960.1 n/a (853) ;mRNA; r:17820-20480